MSGLINKAKEALSSNKSDSTHPTHTTHGYDSTATTGTTGHNQHSNTSTNYGPHGTVGNKLDPRVDSDRDNRNDPTSRVGGYGGQQGTYGHTSTGTSTNQGPHNSNLLNKLDPRVDSDGDNRNDPTSRVGGYGGQSTYSASDANPAPSSGYGHSTTGTSGHAHTGHSTAGYGSHGTSTNAGPHNSNIANKLDPRVDSDRDNRNDPTSRVGGYGSQGNYSTGGANPAPSGTGAYSHTPTSHQTGYGTHTAGTGGGLAANDHLPGEPNTTAGFGTHGTPGGLEGQPAAYNPTTATGHGTSGYGSNTNTTTGPHKSNLLNKLDPRVDSDRDGSKTYGNTGGR